MNIDHNNIIQEVCNENSSDGGNEFGNDSQIIQY
jgi:hypothetical protein